MQFIKKLAKNDEGATAIEYGLIAALIAVAAIGALTQVGNSVKQTFQKVDTTMDAANAGQTGV